MNSVVSTIVRDIDTVEIFGLTLDEQQINAATSPSSRLAIIASAGSGKTRVITQRIKYLCETTNLKPNQVLAITFTRKAGFELAKRIRSVLGDNNRLHPVVSTLHSFVMNELIDFYGDNPREFTLEKFKNVWELYENYLTKNHKYSHDDLLIKYIQLLEDPSYLETRQYLYRHIFVDEFQDSTRTHVEIYQRLVGNKINISVVGDPDQSIFSFAGSSEKYLNDFSNYFPGATIEFLTTNYRSTKANVEVARSVLGNTGKSRKITTPRQSTILPKVHLFSDELAEAQSAMSILMSAHANGTPFSDMAILVRTNKQKDLFIKSANSLGIAFHRGRRIELNETASEIFDTTKTLRRKRKWKSVYDALDDITSIENEDAGKKETYKQLRNAAREYMDLFSFDRQGDVNGFFEYLEFSITGAKDSKDGFSLLTFHQAKGLEFHTCIVSGFEKGLVPLYSDRIRKTEESRLAYVALSRASDELHITRVKVRTLFDRICVQSDSEYLQLIEEHIADIDLRQDFFTAKDALKRIADIRTKHLE